MIAASSEGSSLATFKEKKISDKNFGFSCLSEPDGGVYSIQKLVMSPITEITVQKIEAIIKSLPVTSRINEARNVPKMMARKVKDVINPLAPEIFSTDTNSGNIPYLDGPKKALCAASKKSTM